MSQVYNNLKNNFCDFLGKIIITRQDDQRRSLNDERWLQKTKPSGFMVGKICTTSMYTNPIYRDETKHMFIITYLLKSAHGLPINWTKFTDFNYSSYKTPKRYYFQCAGSPALPSFNKTTQQFGFKRSYWYTSQTHVRTGVSLKKQETQAMSSEPQLQRVISE